MTNCVSTAMGNLGHVWTRWKSPQVKAGKAGSTPCRRCLMSKGLIVRSRVPQAGVARCSRVWIALRRRPVDSSSAVGRCMA